MSEGEGEERIRTIVGCTLQLSVGNVEIVEIVGHRVQIN